MGEPPFPDLKPLGHDLDPDNNDDVDWLLKWAKNAEYEVAALEAALEENKAQWEGMHRAIDKAWSEKVQAAEARAKALEDAGKVFIEHLRYEARDGMAPCVVWIPESEDDDLGGFSADKEFLDFQAALAHPGEPAGGEDDLRVWVDCGDEEPHEEHDWVNGIDIPENPTYWCHGRPAARPSGRE